MLSLAVKDAERSLEFYREVVGIEETTWTMGTVCLDLPGMMVFLADLDAFTRYSREAKRTAFPPPMRSSAAPSHPWGR